MKSTIVSITFVLIASFAMQAQDKNTLPYYEIHEAPKEFTAGAMVSRTVDGLGFRFYWATEGLKEKDLGYKPSENARTCEQTIDHILGLSQMIVNVAKQVPNTRSQNGPTTFAEKRAKILHNFKEASDLFRKVKDMSTVKIKFQGGAEMPFWNMLNGPIGDALWHTGQIVSFRRASGNPLPQGVSVFSGKVRK